jgi:hypothetical protein
VAGEATSPRRRDEVIRVAAHLVNLSITSARCAGKPAPCGLSEVEGGRANCATGGSCCEGRARSPSEGGDAARWTKHTAVSSELQAQLAPIGPVASQKVIPWTATHLLNILRDDSERAAMEWSDRGGREFAWREICLRDLSGSKEARVLSGRSSSDPQLLWRLWSGATDYPADSATLPDWDSLMNRPETFHDPGSMVNIPT